MTHTDQGQPSVQIASRKDLTKILALQKEAFLEEAKRYNDFNLPPLLQSEEEIDTEFEMMTFLKIEMDGEIIGSIRAHEEDNICHVGKLIVSPKHQNKGLGSTLLLHIETRFPNVRAYELFTGTKSEKNLYLYKKNGYEVSGQKALSPSLSMIFLQKKNTRSHTK